MTNYDVVKFCVYYLFIGLSIMKLAKKINDAGILTNIAIVLTWPIAVVVFAIGIDIIDRCFDDFNHDDIRD